MFDLQKYFDGYKEYGPAKIANTFKDKGIKGLRGSCSDCPLAVDIKNESGARSVIVNAEHATIATDFDSYLTPVKLPNHFKKFIENFDCDEYPFLDANIKEEIK